MLKVNFHQQKTVKLAIIILSPSLLLFEAFWQFL